MQWISLDTPPQDSGVYLIGHSGVQVVTSYLHPKGKWANGAKIGWQKDPRDFGATHWAAIEELPQVELRDMWRDYRVGAEIEFTYDCNSYYDELIQEETDTPKWQFWKTRTILRNLTHSIAVNAGQRGKIIGVVPSPVPSSRPLAFLVEVDHLKLNFPSHLGIPFKVIG